MTIYLDNNATTPMEPEVIELVLHYMREEYGNSGSHSHEYGLAGKKAVEKARKQVAAAVQASPDEVTFTSGATESNNLAILGLESWMRAEKKLHIVTTSIEHKAVVEPVERLENSGFEVTFVAPQKSGHVRASDVLGAVRKDTGLVSVMAVNNETGAIQPISDIANEMSEDGPYFHVDAAQSFGKLIRPLTNPKIDLISISGHKIYGPKGVGALIARRREYSRPPLKPLLVGGGQERGLRPGTLPVPLIAGLGLASELAIGNNEDWWNTCQSIKQDALSAFKDIGAVIHSEKDSLPNVINVSIPGVDSEAAMLALKGIAAVSNGSACTSASQKPSHVLEAMQLSPEEIEGALRISWNHRDNRISWESIISVFKSLL